MIAREPRPQFFDVPRPRLLLVASTGGHLSQLVRLAEREQVSDDSVWLTFDSPQSRALLADRSVLWTDYVAPRDARGTLRAYRKLSKSLDPRHFAGAISTGAAVAVAGLGWAKRHGLPTVYVESVSRTDGPSLSGRIVRKLGIARTYTQHSSWASRDWSPTRSVLQDVRRERADVDLNLESPLKILVTLGTIRPYRFDALVDRVKQITMPGDNIVWQLGETTRDDLPGAVHNLIPADELLQHALNADAVITHSGVGTILQMLDHEISPVVVPRRMERGEHVDDHQTQIWNLLRDSEIAHPVEVESLTRETLITAASSRTVGCPQ
ncbi:glycosyltransferase [Leucobacter sp. USHLN153]|uniref:glycosyltransferase n=1 Tax=Leucobacter sp. USHLN153 TaxID=3081268 RepID=UPI00301A7EE4